MAKLYPFLSAALAFLITTNTHESLADVVKSTVEGTALAPSRYRPSFGYIAQPMLETLGSYIASWVFWFLTLAILALLIDEIGRKLGNRQGTQLALLASYIALPMMVLFRPTGAYWSMLEAVCVAAGLLLIINRRYWWLYPLVFLASTNRETAVFIPLMFFCVTRDWKHTAGLLLVWAATYGAIRLAIGPVPLQVTLGEILAINLETGRGLFEVVIGLLLYSWMFWYAWKGWKNAPVLLKRAAYIIPPYLLLVGVFGIWREWRLLFSIFPLLVPLAGMAGSKYRVASGEMVKLAKITGTAEPLDVSNIVWHDLKQVKDE